MDSFQTFLLIILVLLAFNYLGTLLVDRIIRYNDKGESRKPTEGFEDTDIAESGADAAEESRVTILANDELYDDFYASVYDKLAQGIERTAGKVALTMAQWKKYGMEPKDMRILDAGCGTGVATLAFKKLGAGSIIGLDTSEAMLRQARNVTSPATTLTDEARKEIEWRKGDLMNPSTLAGAEVNCAIVYYFTVYYVRDLDTLFRNLGFWVAPGGNLVVEVVNKHKFDPILDSASPFAGFSIQKYADKRHTKSHVAFDKFEYEAEFALLEDENHAEFKETFKFKDGSKRKQKHSFTMPDIKKIVNAATFAGWTYKAYLDTTALGFEYGYLLFFTH